MSIEKLIEKCLNESDKESVIVSLDSNGEFKIKGSSVLYWTHLSTFRKPTKEKTKLATAGFGGNLKYQAESLKVEKIALSAKEIVITIKNHDEIKAVILAGNFKQVIEKIFTTPYELDKDYGKISISGVDVYQQNID